MKNEIKNKIEELKKGCGKWIRTPNSKIQSEHKCGEHNFLCQTCKAKLQAYEEAKKLLEKQRKEFLEKIENLKKELNETNWQYYWFSSGEGNKNINNKINEEIDKIISENHMCPKDMVKSNAGDSPSDYQNGSVPEDTSNKICEKEVEDDN